MTNKTASQILQTIFDKADKTVEKAREQQAKLVLNACRKIIAKHDTHNHKIAILAGNGMAIITIDGEPLKIKDSNYRGIFKVLEEIDRYLDDYATYSYYLHNETLN